MNKLTKIQRLPTLKNDPNNKIRNHIMAHADDKLIDLLLVVVSKSLEVIESIDDITNYMGTNEELNKLYPFVIKLLAENLDLKDMLTPK